ncbi:hypothetical protein D9757_009553 [Collybiopsis confluens]|uniref:Uncharacterized protein n=1 Tax=Collybiopsis confluens TaxID=2823264 RepID=A0A8H5H8N8_9AGAR|nr:hypothetical protein D9757_009553 [Collybiopsis confluens]
MDDDDEHTQTFVLSGYSVLPSRFRGLVRSLCFPPNRQRRRRHHMDYVIAYDFWRRHLPADISSKVPEVICLYKDPNREPIRYYFFTRFVPFINDAQLNPDGAYSQLWHPTAKDRQRLAAFKELIEACDGSFDTETLEFGCIKKEMHVSKRKWYEILDVHHDLNATIITIAHHSYRVKSHLQRNDLFSMYPEVFLL